MPNLHLGISPVPLGVLLATTSVLPSCTPEEEEEEYFHQDPGKAFVSCAHLQVWGHPHLQLSIVVGGGQEVRGGPNDRHMTREGVQPAKLERREGECRRLDHQGEKYSKCLRYFPHTDFHPHLFLKRVGG